MKGHPSRAAFRNKRAEMRANGRDSAQIHVGVVGGGNDQSNFGPIPYLYVAVDVNSATSADSRLPQGFRTAVNNMFPNTAILLIGISTSAKSTGDMWDCPEG